MRVRHRRTIDTVRALGESLDTADGMYAAHYKLFIAKLAAGGSVSGQTGHFYRWYDSPSSSSFLDAAREAMDASRFENATGTSEYETPPMDAERTVAREVRPPEDWKPVQWYAAVSSIAYLLSAGWESDRLMERDGCHASLEEREFQIALEQLAACGVIDPG
jgi:hypothetical protein